jgi:hypothetical protein
MSISGASAFSTLTIKLAVGAVIGEPVSVSFSLFVGKMQGTFGA